MMRHFVLVIHALLLCQAAAFTSIVPKPDIHHDTHLAAAKGDYELLDGERKMNLKIDLDSPKVATMDEIEKGKKVYCRCWLSGTFPLCDGTHMKHNAAIGDNVGPLIVSLKKPDAEEEEEKKPSRARRLIRKLAFWKKS